MARALTVREDTNMDGGAHETNAKTARRAAREGRDIVVHAQHYDGQRYHYNTYRVSDLRELPDGRIVGIDEYGEPWAATGKLCRYAETGDI